MRSVEGASHLYNSPFLSLVDVRESLDRLPVIVSRRIV